MTATPLDKRTIHATDEEESKAEKIALKIAFDSLDLLDNGSDHKAIVVTCLRAFKAVNEYEKSLRKEFDAKETPETRSIPSWLDGRAIVATAFINTIYGSEFSEDIPAYSQLGGLLVAFGSACSALDSYSNLEQCFEENIDYSSHASDILSGPLAANLKEPT